MRMLVCGCSVVGAVMTMIIMFWNATSPGDDGSAADATAVTFS